MGYFVTGNGKITLNEQDIQRAYEAMCELNDHDDLKNGGSWGGGGITSDDPRPEGLNHHPARWFSWCDANYPDTRESFDSVLEMLGFSFVTSTELGEGTITYSLNYDNKMGQESLFLEAIAPFVVEGSIEWVGEDNAMWMDYYADGVLETLKGVVEYRRS